MTNPLPSRVIVIGTSAGGVPALLQLVQDLPHDLDAAVLIVLHVGANASMLPQLLGARCQWKTAHAQHGESPRAGAIYVAPPDHHLLLDAQRMQLTRGPKENHARPAIDPLFRSAALSWGRCVIGVILTGQLDDGSAGLQAIKECGGITVVQNPLTAAQPGMPRAAMAAVQPDLCVDLRDMGAALARIARTAPPHGPMPRPSRRIWHEVRINKEEDVMSHVQQIGTPSSLTCPDCGGALFEIDDAQPLRFRCHIGHALSAESLHSQQDELTEQMLRGGVRALQEREMLLRRLALVSRGSGRLREALVGEHRADEVREQALSLRRFIEGKAGEGGA